jgi:hypothetical protein
MNKFYFILLLCLFSSCRINKTNHVETCKTENDSTEQFYDQSEGMEILDTLGKVYGNEPHIAGLSLETPNCPDFIEGIYFDKATLVFQVTGDTVKARQILEKASGSKNFRLELMGGSNYSQTQLLAIHSGMVWQTPIVVYGMGTADAGKNIAEGANTYRQRVEMLVNSSNAGNNW